MTTTTSTSRRSSSDGALSVCPTPGHLRCLATPHGTIHLRCTTRADGDFHRREVPFDELESRRRSLVDLPWTMLDERHGTRAVHVAVPGAGDGHAGDIAVTAADGAVLGVWVGDCAPLVLIGAGRRLAAVHAGWKGLAAGVVDAAVAAVGEPVARAVLGPRIDPCCYEFGADELAAVGRGVHADVAEIAGRTATGRPALDVGAAVAAACRHHAIALETLGGCTGCGHDGFSHRVRRDRQRHVLAVWREPGAQ